MVPGRPIGHVGYVFQKDTLFPWRTVEDNIGYALELAGVPAGERKARIKELLDGFSTGKYQGYDDLLMVQ